MTRACSFWEVVTLSNLLKPTELAPDFEAEAYNQGDKITVRLSDYRGHWVVLFFYSSDFTFV